MAAYPGFTITLEASTACKSGNGSWSWNTGLSCDGYALAEDVHLQDPLKESEKSELRWYLEEYVQKSSFDLTRARSAANLVRGYAQNVANQLKLLEIVQGRTVSSPSGQQQPVQITLAIKDADRDEQDENSTIQQLHWELLEDLERWKELGLTLVVRRLRSSSEPIPGVLHSVRSWPTQDMSRESVNVLLVVARDIRKNATPYGDISPFTSLEIFTRIQREINTEESLMQLNVEVVRPGTLSALKLHLDRTKREKGPGYFHLVHFDLHGSVAKRSPSDPEEGLLLFNDPKSYGRKAYPAKRVAQWLKIYRIPCVVLNACESARADVGEQANMARTFLNGGVGNVLAMTFEVCSGAVELFLRRFYLDLFVSGLTFSQAAHSGREALKSRPIRDARFRRQRELLDWFIPVVYSSGMDFSVVPRRQTLQRKASLVPDVEDVHDEPVIGRDFDLLRLERTLLQHKRLYLTAPPGFGKTVFLKWACKVWEATKFRHTVIYIDLSRTELQWLKGLLDFILGQLSKSSNPEEYDENPELLEQNLDLPPRDRKNGLTIINILSKRRAILAVDGLHAMRMKSSDEAIPPVIRFLEFLCSNSPETLAIFVLRHTQDTVIDIGQDVEYELAALELPDASELFGFALKSKVDGIPKSKTQDLEGLFRFCKLMQGVPACVTILEETLKSNLTLEFFMSNIYTHIRAVYASLSVLLDRDDVIFAELRGLVSSLPSDELSVFLALGIYWHEGPYFKEFAMRLVNDLLCESQDCTTRVLNLFSSKGYLKIDRGAPSRVAWIHPLFTMFSRLQACKLQDTGRCKFATIAALSITDCLHFDDKMDIFTVDWRRWFLDDVDQKRTISTDHHAGQQNILEGCLQNTLTAILLCCDPTSGLSVDDWPADHLMAFALHLGGSASAAESSYITSKYDELLSVVLKETGDRILSHQHSRIIISLLMYLILARKFTTKANSGSRSSAEYVKLMDTSLDGYEAAFGEDETLLLAKQQFYFVERRWDEAEKALLALEKIYHERRSNSVEQQPNSDSTVENLRGSIRDGLDHGEDSVDPIAEKASGSDKKELNTGLLREILKALNPKNSGTNCLTDENPLRNLSPDTMVHILRTLREKPRLFSAKSVYALVQSWKDDRDVAGFWEKLKDPNVALNNLESASDTLNWPEASETHLRLQLESFKSGKWLETVEHLRAARESVGSTADEDAKKSDAIMGIMESGLDILDFERFSKVKTKDAAIQIYQKELDRYEAYADELGRDEEEREILTQNLKFEMQNLEEYPKAAARCFDPASRKQDEDELKELIPHMLSREGQIKVLEHQRGSGNCGRLCEKTSGQRRACKQQPRWSNSAKPAE